MISFYSKISIPIYFDTRRSVHISAILNVFLLFNILIEGSRSHIFCENYCKCLGSFVDCSNQQLSRIPNDFPSWIETLRLNKNSFAEIPLFPSSNNLTYLNLAHNKISIISREALDTISNLRSLELNNNIISEINVNSFINSSHLEILNLNSNNITRIESATFNGLKHLKELKLNRNKLYQIYKDIFKPINSVQTLELNKNQLSNIIGLSFQELEHLVILRLRQNVIDDLADGAFYGLYNLKELCLDYNRLTHISKGWLYGLELLNHLNASYNKIQYLNNGWESCPHLTELDLSNNKIQSIEKGTFEHLLKLQLLKLDHNHISFIEDGAFDFTPSLQHLDLSSNRLSWIVENVGGTFVPLKKLSHLYLAANRISLVIKNAFLGLENLSYLDLDENEITEIKENPFNVSSHLKTLILNTSSFICDCSLAWLPVWLKSIQFPDVKTDNLWCMHPVHLKRKAIQQIPASDFVCASDDHPQPFITVDPEDVVALVGNNVTLRCGANSSTDSDMDFAWKKNNYKVENVSFRRYASAQTYGVTQFSDLQLLGITMANNGFYQCSVSNNYGVAYSKPSQLSVLVFPSFVKVPVNVEEKVGNTAKLECAATGYPVPRISWQKDGGSEFPAAQERRIKIEEAFFIVNVKLTDVGMYTCTARNAAGLITANATLTALESPSISKKMEDKEVTIGEAIVIECMAAGSPKPKINWLKDGQSLEISKRHFLTAEDQLLIIMDTAVEDSGIYECLLSNSLGSKRGTSHLVVLPLYKNDFKYKEIVIVIALTIIVCALGTSSIWMVIIWRDKRRKCRNPSPMSPVDNKSENSSHSSKDSGTGDSTKRSYQDLLLSASTNNNSIEVIHEERSDSPSSVPEVTLPLLTTFHPIGIDTTSSLVVPFIKDTFTLSKSRFAPSTSTTISSNSQSRPEYIPATTTTVCSSPASSNGVQCACLMGTFKKKPDLCECLANSSPVKHNYYTVNHCTMHNDQYDNSRCYNNNESGNKRPCSIPIPCHHLAHPQNTCCRHPNSYLCLYMPQQHNMP